jgi:hypothetical protein
MRRGTKILLAILAIFGARVVLGVVYLFIGEELGLIPQTIFVTVCVIVTIALCIYFKKHPRKPKEQVPEKVDPSEIPEWVKEEERKEREQKNENP